MRRSIVTCNSRPRAKCATNDRVEWRFRLDSASDLGFCL
jgi:hypothetical protein